MNVCGAGVECAAGAALAARALLAAAETGDAAAAALLARALWNAHAHAPLSPTHAQQASTALGMFIGKSPDYHYRFFKYNIDVIQFW